MGNWKIDYKDGIGRFTRPTPFGVLCVDYVEPADDNPGMFIVEIERKGKVYTTDPDSHELMAYRNLFDALEFADQWDRTNNKDCGCGE